MANRTIEALESRRLLSLTPGERVDPPSLGPPSLGPTPVPTSLAEEPSPPSGLAIVRGNVFRDANRNAIRDPGEVGQPNIRVFLDYNDNGLRDGDAEPIAITNSTGGYRFENARAPAVIAVRLLLAGTNFVQTLPTLDAPRRVTTTIGGNFELEGFGVAEPTVPPPTTTIVSGIVYTDLNGNAVRDPNEAGRANVKVYIDTNNSGGRDDGEPLAITNGEGRYTFTNITGGQKVLRLLLTGTQLQQTQPTGNAPVIVNVVLPSAAASVQAAPFGVKEFPVVPPTPAAIITGTVFYDTNQNAVRDQGERGRSNVRVFIDLDNDAVRDANEPLAITNPLGQYRFERAPVSPELHLRLDLLGTRLKQTLPLNNGARVLATVAGQIYRDQNFGVVEVPIAPPPTLTGIIRGKVFNDADQDGVPDDGEAGVAGKTVYLDLDHGGTRNNDEPQTLTNLEGRYTFERVPAGTYDVRLIREGFVQTSPPNNGANVAIVTAGAIVGDKNFGIYRPTPTIAIGTGRERSADKDESLAAAVLG